jgi:hypothetical protein
MVVFISKNPENDKHLIFSTDVNIKYFYYR